MFLSANNFFWRVTRHGDFLTRKAQWRDLGRPESALIGVQYIGNDRGVHRGRTPSGTRTGRSGSSTAPASSRATGSDRSASRSTGRRSTRPGTPRCWQRSRICSATALRHRCPTTRPLEGRGSLPPERSPSAALPSRASCHSSSRTSGRDSGPSCLSQSRQSLNRLASSSSPLPGAVQGRCQGAASG